MPEDVTSGSGFQENGDRETRCMKKFDECMKAAGDDFAHQQACIAESEACLGS